MLTLLLLGLGAFLLAGLAWAWTPDRPRAQLERRWLDHPSDMVRIGDRVLHLRDSGRDGARDGPRDGPRAGTGHDRPAVILLHGFGASLHTWEPWAEALAAHFRVIRYDLPGFGLSPPRPDGRYGLDPDIADLAAVMDHLGLTRASLIGNSMGGKVAWHFAARFPERVERLVLIAPDGFARPGQRYGEAPRVGPAVTLMRFFLPKPLLRANIASAYADPARLTPETVARYHDLMLAPGARAAMIERFRQAVLPDPATLLPRLTMPVLLVWGDQDRLIPVGHAEDYLRLLPDARLVRFPTLGHLPHEEEPSLSLPPVLEFLAP